MAKALGVDAGLILGNAAIIEQFRTSPVYAGSSPPSPGLLYAFVNSADIYSNELKKLRMNLRFFTDLLNSESGLHFINDFPIFLLKDDIIATGLLKNGINISSFPYPDPNGKSLHRIVLNSIHQREDLEILANTIKKLVDIKN
jgi:7-keto-8-aminopelargonate synthetase-like enzyme